MSLNLLTTPAELPRPRTRRRHTSASANSSSIYCLPHLNRRPAWVRDSISFLFTDNLRPGLGIVMFFTLLKHSSSQILERFLKCPSYQAATDHFYEGFYISGLSGEIPSLHLEPHMCFTLHEHPHILSRGCSFLFIHCKISNIGDRKCTLVSSTWVLFLPEFNNLIVRHMWEGFFFCCCLLNKWPLNKQMGAHFGVYFNLLFLNSMEHILCYWLCLIMK